ncbi:MAG: HD domain-containing phosphohydrolase [Clostridia bacterium]|jgi:HD-GYP domain-containing protein (c-di-GMP phosphodiesterase class II)|nr:HD domain-containing phosphohydrolase [Clostridia bacterium]
MNDYIKIVINSVPAEIYIAVIIGLLLIFLILLSHERDKARQVRREMELLETVLSTADEAETASVQDAEVHSCAFPGIAEHCRMLLDLTNEMTGAADAFLLSEADDPEDYAFYRALLGDDSLRGLTKEDKDFFALPGSLKNYEAELVLIIKIPALYFKGVAVFWYKELPQNEYYRFTGLQLMIKKMADLWDCYGLTSEQSVSILEMLKTLAQIIDDHKPHTIGFSDLMARYAGIIAREMKLDKETTADVVSAAQLSNLGLLGISDSFGAEVVAALLDNPRAVNFIRYQYEKIDGSGACGLQGTEIPVGARILAVAREFLRKINGAQDQEPLAYEKTVDYLKAQAGNSLDQVAVNALLRWFVKKQENPEMEGRSLGKCREMRCAPRRICENCPADALQEQNCWEVEGVLCAAHGNTCASCFVYTEYLARMGPKFGV